MSLPGDDGRLLTLKTEKWVQNGYCIAHDSNLPVFVHGAIPGETVKAKVLKARSSHLFASTVEILSPSQNRREIDCAAFPECGGCSFRHIDYDEEIKIKINLLREIRPLGEILNIDPENYRVSKKVFIASPDRYRNHAQIHYDGRSAGFFSLHSNRVTAMPEKGCLLLSESLNEAVLRAVKNTKQNKERKISLRDSSPGEIKIDAGDAGDFAWEMPGSGFFQTNRFLLPAWLDYLRSQIPSGKPAAVELFCGTGIIGAVCRGQLGNYAGFDLSRSSLDAARRNFKNLDMEGKFYASNLYENCPELKTDLLICNPPRAGLKSGILEKIRAGNIPWILISSCNPQTMNRDLQVLIQDGYRSVSGTIFDFFPRTPHLEVVLLLEKNR